MARHWIATRWGAPESWELVDVAVPAPEHGEVTITVRAAGVNPADAKHVAAARPGTALPVPIGYEVSGEITAVGPRTRVGSGEVQVGETINTRLASGRLTSRVESIIEGS